jgi:hypothetical protein
LHFGHEKVLEETFTFLVGRGRKRNHIRFYWKLPIARTSDVLSGRRKMAMRGMGS